MKKPYLRGEEDPAHELPVDSPLPHFLPGELEHLEAEGMDLEAAYAEEHRINCEIDAGFSGNLVEVLAFLKRCHGGDDCDGTLPAPTEVLSVHSASKVTGTADATVRCSDGRIRRALASYAEYGGGYTEPPGCDVDYEYLDTVSGEPAEQ